MVNHAKKRRSSVSKKKLNLPGSLNNFQVTSMNSNDRQTTNGTIFERDGILSVKAKENVYYVLIKKPNKSYSLLPDCCYSIKLILYSKLYMQVDGYRCKPCEHVKVSTCFGYNSSIVFFKTNEPQESSGQKDRELFQSELGDRYAQLIAFDELNMLYDGHSVLLRVEVDTVSMSQFKLVREYILKSNSPTAAHDQISLNLTQAQSNINPIVVCNEDSNLLDLNRRLNVITDKLDITSRDVILVCGAINCGKSTLIHHMINRYLSNGNSMKRALYLECDPGQTEFAPSGILSLITIDKKVISSPGFKFISNDHSALLTRPGKIVSKIFGTTTPSDHASTYISLIKHLSEEAKSMMNKSKMPLFINTMGWIEGLGLELLLKILDLTRPSHVIRIQNFTENIDDDIRSLKIEGIVPMNVPTYKISSSNFPQDICSLISTSRFNRSKLWLAYACVMPVNDSIRSSPFKNASLRREINQLAYVTSGFWPEISVLPFYVNFTTKLPLANLFVHCFSNPNIYSASIYDLLNASWVVLGNISSVEVAKLAPIVSESQEPLKLIRDELKNANCLGCGVVRAIDLTEQCMHVLMPKALCDLVDDINLIVLPDLISIPSGLLNEQFLYQSNSSLPFIFSYFEQKK